MKFSRLILLAVVPLVAAMGGQPDAGRAGSGYVRPDLGAQSDADAGIDPVEAPLAQGALEVVDAAGVEPGAYLWQARPVVVFADSADDPAFRTQMRIIEAEPAGLVARDVVVITDTDPAANSSWRRSLRPEGFSLVVLDKDGQVKQRKPAPWSVREISRAIDKTPLRRQEIGRARVLP